MSATRFPDVVVIGAQKSGTRWLRDQMADHPQIFMASREVEFFNNHWDDGLGWYAKWFRDVERGTVAGEATPGYLMWTDDPARMAARIQGTLPDVRLVALLRNPVQRTRSAFIHHVRAGRIPRTANLFDFVSRLDTAADELGLVSGSWYGRSVEPYVGRFGERLLALRHDEVRDDPQGLLDRVADHVGVSTGHTPPGLTEVAYSNRPHLPTALIEATALDDDQRRALWDQHFADDMALLARLVDVDVTTWEPQ